MLYLARCSDAPKCHPAGEVAPPQVLCTAPVLTCALAVAFQRCSALFLSSKFLSLCCCSSVTVSLSQGFQANQPNSFSGAADFYSWLNQSVIQVLYCTVWQVHSNI